MNSTATWLSRIVALLKLSRPRTWSFAVSMFVGAYLSTGVYTLDKILVGAAIVALVTALTNLFNAYTDQEEDSVNLPNRQPMLEAIAFRRLKLWITAGYIIAVCVAAYLGPLFTLVVVIAVVDSILYSWGLRLKAHPVFSLVAFSGAVVLPFVAGWVTSRSIVEISPLVIVLGYFFFAYGNIKNLPDIPGDRQAGLRTLFTIYTFDKSVKVVSAVLLSPYVLLCGFIMASLLGIKYVTCFLFMPVVTYIIYRAVTARTREEKEATHALGYFYQLTFFLVALILYEPSPIMIGAAVMLLAISATADYYKVDSRPYDLRLSTLLGLSRSPRYQLYQRIGHKALGLTPIPEQSPSAGRVLQETIQCAEEAVAADSYAVFLKDLSGRMGLAASSGAISSEPMAAEWPTGKEAIGLLAEGDQPILMNDTRGKSVEGVLHGWGSAMVVPLRADSRVIGVLTAVSRQSHAFTKEDLDKLASLAEVASIAIDDMLEHEAARRLAITDPVTGLYNRHYFQMKLERALEEAQNGNKRLALLILDLDEFKKINDTTGHANGDRILRQVGALLQASVREGDIVARYGGEEFAIIMPDAGETEATAVAERIRSLVAQRCQISDTFALSASIGIATYPDTAANLVELVEAADKAMCQAKRLGRNKVCALHDARHEEKPGLSDAQDSMRTPG